VTIRLKQVQLASAKCLLFVGILSLAGLLVASSFEAFEGYVVITISSAAPLFLWLATGAPGIPALPIAASLYYIYFALPVLRGEGTRAGYSAEEVWVAAVSVAAFLMAATFVYGVLLSSIKPRVSGSVDGNTIEKRKELGLIQFGLSLSIAFHLAVYEDLLSWLGSGFGAVRFSAFALSCLSCFLLGYARGEGSLRGRAWKIACLLLIFTVLLSWSSLFLVSGILMVGAAFFGFIISARQIPWKAIISSVVVVAVLHSGKSEMRQKYWLSSLNWGSYSLMSMPFILLEWTEAGLKSLLVDSQQEESVLDRTSLLTVLLRVQRLSPNFIPYLQGETYEMIPELLVPRILAPEKKASQAAMVLLNLRFGIQTAEQAAITALGWGLIPEAFANFGMGGVIGIGLLLGGVAGLASRLSANAAKSSLRFVLATSITVTLLNIEADLPALVSACGQMFVVVGLFWAVITSANPSAEGGTLHSSAKRLLPPRAHQRELSS
jgi:hypothetical protein